MSAEPNTAVDKVDERAPQRPDRWARMRHLALVLLTAFVGFICIRSSYTALRDRGAAVWALSLMLCFLAASSWMLTFSLLRSGRPKKTAPQDGPAPVEDRSPIRPSRT
jgi:hypothetical protein